MSDDSTKSPSREDSKSKREIKIGSQRPGYVSDLPNEKKVVTPRAVVPVPPHKQESQLQGEPPEVTPAEAAPIDATADASESVAHDAVVLPPEDAEMTPSEQAIVGELTVAQIDLEVSDEDLELEISRAIGDGVDDLMASQVERRSDDVEIEIDLRYLATVLKTYRDSVLFELPGQRNGVIPLKQFGQVPESGTQLEVVVTGFSNDDQLYELVVPGASVHVADWSDIQEGVVVDAKITGENKGGLECELNHIRGFIPAREISLYRVEDFSTYVDQTLSCIVKEADEARRNLVLSHRAVLEREREATREKLMAELAVGQTREGTVTKLQKFGAFVDIGGIDGLIHISQLSWDNIRHPEEVVQEGQRVTVRIEKIDPQTGKIGLSYRDLLHNPWEGIVSKYPVGTVVPGIVSKIMDFGAFVRLEPGVEGLVHISELSNQRVNRVSHVVQEGQGIEVKILSVDEEAQKLSLSMKAAQGVPVSGDADDQSDEPKIQHNPKVPVKSLKGGVRRPTGGEQFGLNW